MEYNKIITGDVFDILKTLPDKSIHCCITSPPYWNLRDYGTGIWVGGDVNCKHVRTNKKSKNNITGHKNFDKMLGVGDAIQKDVCSYCGARRIDSQIGLEKTPDEYVKKIVNVFKEIKRILRDDGTVWLNLGDTYSSKNNNGLKPKDLIGIPWMIAFALRNDGWYLRQDIIWKKPNPMPESVKDRCTKSHEYIFLLSKNKKYYYDYKSIKEPAKNWGTRDRSKMRNGTIDPKLKHHGLTGKPDEKNPMKNKRSVWTVVPKSFKGAHFATFPPDLIIPCVLAGCPEGGIVLDPFSGAGTTALVSKMNKRNYIGIELNPKYVKLSEKRLIDYERSQDPFYDFK